MIFNKITILLITVNTSRNSASLTGESSDANKMRQFIALHHLKFSKLLFLPLPTSAVPNVFGMRDWFHGRQFFHGCGKGVDGSSDNVSTGDLQMKVHLLTHQSLPAVQ